MSIRLRLACAATLLAMLPAFAAEAGEPEWIRQFGTLENDFATAIATGVDGRVHVVGRTGGAIGARKGYVDAFIVTFAADGSELWRRQPGTSGVDTAEGVATDADGNVYVVGSTEGALGGSSKGRGDVFIIKFDRDGRTLWKRQPGSSKYDRAAAVATDTDGNVFVAGNTSGTVGGSQKGSRDAFVIKFERDGRTLWKRQPGTDADDYAQGIAADTQGNLYLAGETFGALLGAHRGRPLSPDAFIIKYDPDGRPMWKRQPGTTFDDSAHAVATDVDGTVYLTGTTKGSLGGPKQSGENLFVIHFDRDGTRTWSTEVGTPPHSINFGGIATDTHGNFYLAGDTGGEVAGLSQGSLDAFVIKYAPTGSIVWAAQQGSPDIDFVHGVAVDADGAVYLAGDTSGALPGNASRGKYDVFLIKYGPNGPQ